MAVYTKALKEKLGFDTEDFSVAASAIIAKCATDEKHKKFLIDNNKLAYVLNDNQTEVELNCYDEGQFYPKLRDAQFTLMREISSGEDLSTSSKVLLAHEVLRVMGKETEKAYLPSSNIKKVELAYPEFIAEKIMQMSNIQDRQNSCTIRISYLSRGTKNNANFHGDFAGVTIRKFSSPERNTELAFAEWCNTFRSNTDFSQQMVRIGSQLPDVEYLIQRLNDLKCFND